MSLDWTCAITLAMVVPPSSAKRSTEAPDKEVRPEVLGQAVEFVDVALAVADMHAALRRACQFGGQGLAKWRVTRRICVTRSHALALKRFGLNLSRW